MSASVVKVEIPKYLYRRYQIIALLAFALLGFCCYREVGHWQLRREAGEALRIADEELKLLQQAVTQIDQVQEEFFATNAALLLIQSSRDPETRREGIRAFETSQERFDRAASELYRTMKGWEGKTP